MRGILSAYIHSKRGTLKYEFAIAAFAVWALYLARLALADSPEWIAAQAVPFGTVTTTVFLFIATAVGLQAYQNIKGTPPPSDPAWETGEPETPIAEAAARKAG